MDSHADVDALRRALAQTYDEIWLHLDGRIAPFPSDDTQIAYDGNRYIGTVPVPLEPRHTLFGTGVPLYPALMCAPRSRR